METKTILGEKKEAAVIAVVDVCESIVPRYEIYLPDRVMIAMNLDENSHISFIEENGRFYIEKA